MSDPPPAAAAALGKTKIGGGRATRAARPSPVRPTLSKHAPSPGAAAPAAAPGDGQLVVAAPVDGTRMSEYCTTYRRKKGAPGMTKKDDQRSSGPRRPRPAAAAAAPARRPGPAAASRASVQIVNGQIVVAEQSLEVEEPPDDDASLVEVVEGTDMSATSASFTSRVQTERWGLEETKKFYEALQRFGTDFTLMQSAFPGRTQRQLKNKFKKEEKAHRALVTLALQPNIARPLPSAAPPAPPPDPAAPPPPEAAAALDTARDGDDDDLVQL